MSAKPGSPAIQRSVWGSLARRVDRFLDPAIAIVAATLAVTSLLTTDQDAIDPRLHDPNALAVVATAVAAGSLAWRRKRPVASYAVFVTSALVVSGSFHYIGALAILMLFSLFSLATYGSRREGVVGLGVGIGCFVVLGLAEVPDLRTKDVLLAVALLVASWAVAEALRSRRDQQRDQVKAAVTEERLRIARELHDVVAHSMSLIAVQAGVGAHVIQTDPAAAEQTLDVIADTSRKALEQTRSMLGMLREENEDGTRPPTQGLDDLPALVGDVRAAGLEVELVKADAHVGRSTQPSRLRRTGSSRSRSPTSSSTPAAATRHGHSDDHDDGARHRGQGSRPEAQCQQSTVLAGHGLIGLDERARLVGGTLAHGAER